MTLRAIHHVQLAMPPHGEVEARRFYGALLGLPEVANPFGNRIEPMRERQA